MKIEKTATFDETKLFHEYPVGRYGYAGYICGYFRDGSTKYNITGIELTPEIKEELERVLVFLMTESGHYLIKNKAAMEAFCRESVQCHIPYSYNRECFGFRILSEKYVFYIACTPWNENRAFNLFVYRKDELFSSLAKERGLPPYCYGITPYSGVRILIRYGEKTAEEYPQFGSRRDENQAFADEKNRGLNVTKEQEAAMVGGVTYGWDTPAAGPGNYDADGCFVPRHNENKEKRHIWSKK